MKKTSDQLLLLDPPAQVWRIDAETRAVGRKGLEEARRALAAARPVAQQAA